MKKAQVVCVPFFPRLGEVAGNFRRIIQNIREIQTNNSPDVIVFPELSTSGYLLENLAFSSAIDPENEIPEELSALSAASDIILGALIKENGKIFNAAFVFSRGKLIHIHRKIYLPTYGLFDEKRYFSSGGDLHEFNGRLGKSAVLICEDAFHPVLPYSLYAKGVKHVFTISCSPARGISRPAENSSEPGEIASSQRWLRRLEVYGESFGQFYYYVNRSGSEDGVYFDGKTIFVSPNKESCENYGENPTVLNVYLSDLESASAHGGPFQHEKWDLNRRLLDEAHNANTKKSTEEN